jgi:8-oxo-dGTP pyrophosphatase MutT (NUDIX family)
MEPPVHANTQPDAWYEREETEPVPRPTARVLLVDEERRLLLFSARDESDGHTFWFPAGGGVKEGESFEQAAEREVEEETGLTGLALDAEVWRRRMIGSINGVTYDFQERFYLARVASFEVTTDGFTESERTSVVGHRWWTLDELASSADRLVPGDLYQRLVALLTEGAPRVPIDLTP